MEGAGRAETTLGVTARHGSIRDNTGSRTGDGGIGDVSNGRSVRRNSRGCTVSLAVQAVTLQLRSNLMRSNYWIWHPSTKLSDMNGL